MGKTVRDTNKRFASQQQTGSKFVKSCFYFDSFSYFYFPEPSPKKIRLHDDNFVQYTGEQTIQLQNNSTRTNDESTPQFVEYIGTG